MKNLVLLNCTNHEPTPEMENTAHITPPSGEIFKPSDPAGEIERKAKEKVEEAKRKGYGLLIGGLSSFSGYLMHHAWEQEVPVFEVLSSRERTNSGKHAFNFQGFRPLSEPRL